MHYLYTHKGFFLFKNYAIYLIVKFLQIELMIVRIIQLNNVRIIKFNLIEFLLFIRLFVMS